MTEPEIKEWLGLRPDYPRRLRPEILEGMASVPCPPPGPTNEHVNVFAAFLACCPGPPTRMGNLFSSDVRTPECEHESDNGCWRCCQRCNLDRHLCPGCGRNIDHGTEVCAECDNEQRA